MIVLLIVLAWIVTYMTVGFALVKFDTPRSIARNTKEHTNSRWDGEDYIMTTETIIDREEVVASQWYNQFLWPIMLPARLTQNSTNKALDKVDPAVLKAAKERNKALEEELDREAIESAERTEKMFENQIKFAELEKKLQGILTQEVMK